MNTTEKNDIRSYLDWALKGRSAWWLYIIGAFLLYLVLIIGRMLFGAVVGAVFGSLSKSSLAGQLFVQHLDFVVILIAPFLLAWLLHNRPWWSVAVPKPKLEWWKLGTGFLLAFLWLLSSNVINVLFHDVKITVERQDLSVYLPFFITAIFVFLIQTSAEEVVFRGYYMQAVRRFTASPILMIGLSAAAFASVHRLNLESFGWPWYGILVWFFDGCMLGWLAYRTRSLWMSIGWHWVNNFMLITMINESGRDVVQGMTILTADKLPSLEFILLNKIIIYPLLALVVHWMMNRREKTKE